MPFWSLWLPQYSKNLSQKMEKFFPKTLARVGKEKENSMKGIVKNYKMKLGKNFS